MYKDLFFYFKGGLKAVVWTDVIQTIVMSGAMLLVMVKGTIIVGGFDEVMHRNWNTGRIEMPSLVFKDHINTALVLSSSVLHLFIFSV